MKLLDRVPQRIWLKVYRSARMVAGTFNPFGNILDILVKYVEINLYERVPRYSYTLSRQ